ncbi:MAG: hypothetical protein GY765_19420 [bacterium]|nr:hypothetical protein [bacterium]
MVLKKYIEELEQLKDFSIEGNPLAFDDVLAKIADLNDPRAITELIPFMDDDCDFHEIIFSIIHLIEHFDTNTYVSKLLGALPHGWKKSPEWMMTLHTRIMNSEDTLKEYIKQVGAGEVLLQNVVMEIVDSIAESSDNFGTQIKKIKSVMRQT